MAVKGHSSSVLSSLGKLRSDRFICDFTIFVQGKKFDTHRLILAANSGYFEKYFSRKRDQTSITIENIHPEEMQQCIDYMYTSNCDFEFESVPKILEAARFFDIPHLAEDCLRFLSSNLTPGSCYHVLNLARRSPCDVQTLAQDVIQKNLEIVMSSAHFRKINEDDLFRFICDAEPKIYWKAITTYFRGRERMFARLVQQIDFEKLPFSFLLTTVLSDPLTMCELPWTRQFAVKAIFCDMIRVKQNLNTRNCFLIEILASDPSFRRFVDGTLRDFIEDFMRSHFTEIKSEDGICYLSKDSILSLLQSEDIELEESKWEVILKWMGGDPKRARSKKTFRDLFNTIKLDQLSVNFLKEMVGREEFVTKDAVCMESLMCVLFRHIDHLLQSRPVSLAPEAPNASAGGDVGKASEELNKKEKSEEEEEKAEDAAENPEEQPRDDISVRETSASSNDQAQQNSLPVEEDSSQEPQNADSAQATPPSEPIPSPQKGDPPLEARSSQDPQNATSTGAAPSKELSPQKSDPHPETGPYQDPQNATSTGAAPSKELSPHKSDPHPETGPYQDKAAQSAKNFSFNPLSHGSPNVSRPSPGNLFNISGSGDTSTTQLSRSPANHKNDRRSIRKIPYSNTSRSAPASFHFDSNNGNDSKPNALGQTAGAGANEQKLSENAAGLNENESSRQR